MANFFTDEPDLLFHFENNRIDEVADALEGDYADAEVHAGAPVDAADAMDSYRRVLESVGGLAAEFIAPRAEAADLEGCHLDEDGVAHLPEPVQQNLDMLAKAELMGFTLPRAYDGLDFPHIIYIMAIEMVSRADASLMNLFGLQGVGEIIYDFATDEVKDEYLYRFSSGEVTGAMVLTEPDVGSDLQRVQLRAEENDNGEWTLNGVKRFITNGCGDVLLVLARSEPHRDGAQGLSVFLVDKGPTVQVRRLEDKLGIHGSPTCELQFNNSPARLIGKRQRGLITYVAPLLNGARVGVGAQAVGIGQAALVAAREYAQIRKQFGKRIEEIAPVAEMLVDMTLRVEAARTLLYDTMRYVDLARAAARHGERAVSKKLGRIANLLTPMVKYHAGEMSIRVANDAIQVLGGSGYMRDYPAERYLRDARITTIYEGTSQLQVVAAVRGVLSGVAEARFEELAQGIVDSPAAKHTEVLDTARADLADAVSKAKAAGNPDLLADRWIGQISLLRRNLSEIIDGRDASTLERFDTLVHGIEAPADA